MMHKMRLFKIAPLLAIGVVVFLFDNSIIVLKRLKLYPHITD